MLMMCWARRDTNENGRQVDFVLALHHKMYLTTRRFGEKNLSRQPLLVTISHRCLARVLSVQPAETLGPRIRVWGTFTRGFTSRFVKAAKFRPIGRITAVGTWCQLDPLSPWTCPFFLHQMTKLCTAEWSTRARQLYIKPFVHYQHSRVFPVYASRGDRDDVWRATVALSAANADRCVSKCR